MILVIGGAGFVGSNLIKTLVSDKIIIISLDNYSSGYEKNHIIDDNVKYIKGNSWDILNIEELKSFNPDVIYHFGEYSRISQSFEESSKVFKSNTYGTQQVLEYAVKKKSKLIYSGSSAIFGNYNLSPYAFTKAKNIELIKNYKEWYGLDYCIVYFYNVYGQGQITKGNYATVIGIFEEQYKNKEPLTVVKPGTQTRYFTHIDDIIRGLLLISEKGEGDGYMLGTRKDISIFDLVKMFDTEYVMIESKKGERYTSTMESNKMYEELGWKPIIEIEDYIKMIKQKGIIPIPQGGLGNQIFIYIAGYVMSEYLKCPLYLFNNTNCNNSHSNIEYKNNIFKNLGIHINQSYQSKDFQNYSFHYLNYEQGFEHWDFSSIKPGLVLQSYYQYYKPLETSENKIRYILLSGLEEFKNKLLEKYEEEELSQSAFLHIRRGDYLVFSDRHFIQPMKYYKYCIEKLRKSVRKIYLLSDDIEWVKSQELFDDRVFFEPFECENELTSLSFMTLCKAGAICANSTFSWWGAFLGSYEKRNPIFVPEKWMLTHSQIKIFPKEWIVVKEKDFYFM